MVAMEKQVARTFNEKVECYMRDEDDENRLYASLATYQQSHDIEQLVGDLRDLINTPVRMALYEEIRPLIPLHHQLDYDRLIPLRENNKLRVIRLKRRSNDSLGFAVRGGLEHGIGLYVSHVLPESQADHQGLKVGDELVRVNGFTINQAIHQEALRLIKARRDLVLKVRNVGLIPLKDHPNDKLQWKYVDVMDTNKVVEIQEGKESGHVTRLYVHISVGSGLGCSICSGPLENPGIFIQSVKAGSLAEEAGLAVGDQIISVNGTSFQHAQHSEAVVALKSSRRLNLTLKKGTGLKLFEPSQLRPTEENSRAEKQQTESSDQQTAPCTPRMVVIHVDSHQGAECTPGRTAGGFRQVSLGEGQDGQSHSSTLSSTASSLGSPTDPSSSPASLAALERNTRPENIISGGTDTGTRQRYRDLHDNNPVSLQLAQPISSLRDTSKVERDVSKVEKQELNRLRHEYLEAHQSDAAGITRVVCTGPPAPHPHVTTTQTSQPNSLVVLIPPPHNHHCYNSPPGVARGASPESPMYMQSGESKPTFRFQKPVLLNPIHHSDRTSTSTGPHSPSSQADMDHLAPLTFNPVHLFTNEQIAGRQMALITITKVWHQELGLSIQADDDKHRGRVIVAVVQHGSACHQQGGIHPGDELMMVDGASVVDVPLAQAETVITEAYASTRPTMQLVLAKALSGKTDNEVTYF